MSVNIPLQNDFVIYGGDAEILYRSAGQYSIKTDDLVCSLSLQTGGSIKLIIDGLASVNNFSKIVCIEPYGNTLTTMTKYGANVCLDSFNMSWDPAWGDSTSLTETIDVNFNLSNEVRDHIVPIIHHYSTGRGMDFTFLNIDDDTFYDMYANGITYFENGVKEQKNTYKIVYVDRDATTECALKALNFFKDKIVAGGTIIFDDINLYDFSAVETELANNNFTLTALGMWKAAYTKGL